MRELTFSYFDSVKDIKSKPVTLPWADWISTLSEHDVRTSDGNDIKSLEATKDGPCLVLSEIPEGEPHQDAKVVAVHALGLDIEDKTEEEIATALEPLKGYEYFIYSTHKHKAPAAGGGIRLRVILPLKAPLEPKLYKKVWKGLNDLTQGITDPKTKNIGRVFFAPSTFEPGRGETFHNAGEWLDAKEVAVADAEPESSPESLDAEEKRLRRLLRFMEKDCAVKTAAKHLLRGEPFADAGKRHDTALQLTLWIASNTTHSPISEEAVAAVFEPSLAKMAEADDSAPGMDDLLAGYRGALEKAVENKRHATYRRQLGNEEPYDEDDLRRIAKAQGWEMELLDHHWIIQKDRSYYILNERGGYSGPFTAAEVRPAAVALLRRSPVRLFDANKNGYRRRKGEELVEDYGMIASEIVCDLTEQYTRFDMANDVIREAVCPLRRDIEPKFDPKFDEYLHVLAGKQYDKVCDWLACVPDLNKLLCALYLAGAGNTFKTGIAHGLAQLWHDGPPAEIERIFRDFNEELCKCPLIVADEHVPRDYHGNNITTALRSMVSTHSRNLSRKFLPPATLTGAIRLMLCANNEFLLKSTDVQGSDELKAVAQRFLYIPVEEEAAKWVDANLTKAEKQGWVIGGGIAAHSLYLRDTREVTPGARFWVEGDVGVMHRLLLSASEFNSLVHYWLVHYLMNPTPVDALVQKTGLIRIDKGHLLVNEQALIDYWDVYVKNKRIEPTTAKVGAALRAISQKERIQLRFLGKRVRYRKINVQNLHAWSQESGIGDNETMENTLHKRKSNGAEITDNISSVRPKPTIGQVIALGKVRKQKEDAEGESERNV